LGKKVLPFAKNVCTSSSSLMHLNLTSNCLTQADEQFLKTVLGVDVNDLDIKMESLIEKRDHTFGKQYSSFVRRHLIENNNFRSEADLMD